MKLILIYLSLFTVLSINVVNGKAIYSQSYGNSADPAIIYVHGGPGSNSTLFEATTVEKLVENGFYVIAYDRRGEGRSADPDATFTFEEASGDLVNIYEQYELKNAAILAHSFGGIVAAYFAERYPEKVNAIIIVSALFSQQETYDHILNTAEKMYSKYDDTQMLEEIRITRELSANTAEYRKACYDFAEEFLNMPNPTNAASELNVKYRISVFYANNIRNKEAPAIFYRNETLNNVDTKPILQNLKAQNIQIFAIYGKQDVLFSKKQLNDLKAITGKSNFTLIENCSHFPFVDQQELFLKALLKYMKP